MFLRVIVAILFLANAEVFGNPLFKLRGNPSAQTNCPNQPIPVSFDTIPDAIAKALLQLEVNLSQLTEASGIPGVSAVAVYGQETIWNWNFGMKDKNTGIPPGRNIEITF